MTKLINLTPHTIRIRVESNPIAEPLENDIVLEPEAVAARVSATSQPLFTVSFNGFQIQVVGTVFGAITDLPEPQEDTFYIVSLVVAQAAIKKGRTDLIGPNTAPGQDIRYPAGHSKERRTFAVYSFQSFQL